MPKRVQTTSTTEADVLIKCARRCAVCYGLKRDLRRKKGQIAHADQDPSNRLEANLVFLCLYHHDEYDSTTSQAKNITERELKTYRDFLIEAIARNEHASSRPSNPSFEKSVHHDDGIFKRSNRLITERALQDMIWRLQSDNSYDEKSSKRVQRFRFFFGETGNQYIDPKLKSATDSLLDTLTNLQLFMGKHFFYYPNHQPRENPQYCLYPRLNIDRDGDGDFESMNKYDIYSRQLFELAETASCSYAEYRREIKLRLFI